jgi:hypothetical protein
VAGALVQVVPDKHVQYDVADGGGQRVGDVGGEEQVATVMGLLFDLVAGDDGRQR